MKSSNKKLLVGGIILIFCAILIWTGIAYNKKFVYISEFKGNTLIYNGNSYEEWGASNYQLGKFLCKTKDGQYTLYSIKGDNDNNFLEVSSFLDNYVYKKKDYKVPDSGKVTAIYIADNFMYKDRDIITVLQKLETLNSDTYSFKTDNIYSCAVNIRYCYNECPLGEKWVCRIAHVDGKWIYINTDLNDSKIQGKDGVYQVCNYEGKVVLDENYISILKKYISK